MHPREYYELDSKSCPSCLLALDKVKAAQTARSFVGASSLGNCMHITGSSVYQTCSPANVQSCNCKEHYAHLFIGNLFRPADVEAMQKQLAYFLSNVHSFSAFLAILHIAWCPFVTKILPLLEVGPCLHTTMYCLFCYDLYCINPILQDKLNFDDRKNANLAC